MSAKRTSACGGVVLTGVMMAFCCGGGIWILSRSNPGKPADGRKTDPANPKLEDLDPEAFIARFGKPDADDNTYYDKPRPLMVTRWMIYKTEKVEIIFSPGAGLGDSPTDRPWKIVALTDADSKEPISADTVLERLKKRDRSPPPPPH